MPCFTITMKKVSELSLRLRYAFRTCFFSMIKIFFWNVLRVFYNNRNVKRAGFAIIVNYHKMSEREIEHNENMVY